MATRSVDLVSGHRFTLYFVTLDAPFLFGFGLSVDRAVASCQASGTHLVGDPLTFFPTGTFDYSDGNIPQLNQIHESPYTLTITPGAATAPEPSSLVLLLTAARSSLGVLTPRLRSATPPSRAHLPSGEARHAA